EPIDFTRQADALLTDTEKSRTYWFLYDREVAVAAMGVQANPQADSCRLLTRFKDCFSGFREEVCQQLRYVIVSSGKRPISLRVVHIDAPPDISIPRYLFDPVSWRELPWQGCSCVFQPDEAHLELIKRAQQLIAASPLGTLYQLIGPDHLCLNAVRLLDPFRRTELRRQPQSVVVESTEEEEWRACFEEVDRRLVTVFHSAPWTFWPLRFERADCTSVSLAPIGPGAQECVGAWVAAVEAATGLRNSATHREMLTLDFAYQVFPVEGENAVQARRDLAREITALLQKEWGTMDFRDPKLAVWQTKVWRSEEHSKRLRPTSKVWSEVMTFFPLLVMIFFLLAELDRIMWEARTVECQQLRHGFEGICRASCKEPEDEQRIRAEIGDKVAEVDQAIEVLISAGMSTPALRHVERLGINIDHAGCMELAMPVMFLGPQLLLAIWQDLFNGARRGRWFLVVCQTVSIIARLALLALLCRSGADERCFMLRVMTKLVVLVLVPAFVSVCLGAEGDRMMQRTTFLAFDAVFLLTLGFGLLGIRGTAKMPCLMQLLLARGRPLCHWSNEDGHHSLDSSE
ncbi:unnamed protein product, partial [Effrenium voratum]